MADEIVQRQSLGQEAAFQLAKVTKTVPQYGAITPRWLVRLLDWKPLEAGTFRLNRVDEGKAVEVTCGHSACIPSGSLRTALRRLESARRHRNP